jgi:hypothetical protein
VIPPSPEATRLLIPGLEGLQLQGVPIILVQQIVQQQNIMRIDGDGNVVQQGSGTQSVGNVTVGANAHERER